ncbi:xanthine dehydrogenase small subunit [Aquabacterium sp.]|uniref:xanthine dehydrogenase small subunit n=1 Tax=Aquabacterium sp. TaxID=1872578 RepID=UPI0025C6D428|nr:xanthine dehydrogenase small subunit [Aquabacterium sp.]
MSQAPARPIHFVHQGQVQQVSGLPPTTTVLQWLREHAHCTGTKEGCAEGDCGACTVVVAEADASGALQRRTVNACIQFLPTLDGKALFTVEDLPALNGGALHPCQQALVDCHGSQCGFCTPGFVMSLWHSYEQHPHALPRSDLADALSGNLCRCTGYRPILDAGAQMYEAPRVALDPLPVLALLKQLADTDAPLVYEGPDPAAPGQTARFHAPRTLDELASLRQQLPQARLLAGSTDVGLWVTKQFKPLGDIVYLGRVSALQAITPWGGSSGAPEGIEIGAGATLEAAWSALSQHVPALKEIWLRFASPPVRHAGTMGGNVANGSPIGDSAPILLALGAAVVLRQGSVTREMPLSAFYLDYMKNALAPGEFLQAIRVPLPKVAQGEVFRAYKISKRRDSDISALCAGLMIQLDGDTITAARLGWGGMAGTARRAAATEAALIGQAWNEATLRQAQAALAQDFQPLSDLRATQGYRLKVAANLLERFWLETRPQSPLPASQVHVWPATA